MDPSVKTEPWLDRRDSASSSALRLSAWALASHSSTFTVEKKIHGTVSVSEENKRNHPLETSKHLPGFVKFCFLSLQNVKLLIHQWKYWKFPEYMCCFHGWNLKILLYYEKLQFYDNFLTFGICFSYPFSLTIQFLPLLLLSQSKRKMFSEYEFYNQFTLSHASSFENWMIFSL